MAGVGPGLQRVEGGLNFGLAPFTPFGHQMQDEGCHLDSLKPNAVPWSETSIPAVSSRSPQRILHRKRGIHPPLALAPRLT